MIARSSRRGSGDGSINNIWDLVGGFGWEPRQTSSSVGMVIWTLVPNSDRAAVMIRLTTAGVRTRALRRLSEHGGTLCGRPPCFGFLLRGQRGRQQSRSIG